MKNLARAAVVAASIAVPTFAQADDDWTGFYAGLQAGSSALKSNGATDTNPILGLHVGYDYDFGNYILGGELSYDGGAEYTVDNTTSTSETVRLKVKGGHVFGRTLLYGTFGYANYKDDFYRLDGYSAGVGVSYRATDKITIGAEYLHDVFSRTGDDLTADTITVRASYKF